MIRGREMKFFMRKAAAAVAIALAAACFCLPLSACKKEKSPYNRIGAESDFLKAEGELVKNGEGETVYLRGVNAGGLFVTEHWMTGFSAVTGIPSDYKSLTTTFLSRFKEAEVKALWSEYRANWWTEVDFKNCADMGMNVIRLPFTYMNVDFGAVTDYKNAGNYDFSDLDAFVEKAAEYGMYTILDLHGAYGSQNGKDHSGERIDEGTVDFYYNDEMKELTANLWGALAEHYKDNAAVAGYDILNEPGENAGSTGERHWNFYDQVYKAIRAKDEKHIVIFESCWNGENLPKPSKYGWENCMYSFHHYTSITDESEAKNLEHNVNWNDKIANVEAQNFGVPLQMGEFCSYSSAEKWEYTLDLLNRSNWHWTSWTYKVWSNQQNDWNGGNAALSPWGIYNVLGNNNDKVDPVKDDYQTILNKFKKLRTDGASVQKYTFFNRNEQGEKVEYKTFEKLFSEFASVRARSEKLNAGSYNLFFGDDYLPLTLNGSVGSENVLKIGESAYEKIELTVKYHSSNDKSAYLSVNGRNLAVTEINGDYFVTANGSTANGARFYPVVLENGGVAFVSYSTCKYLRVDENGILRADANRASASTFICENAVQA